MMTGVCRGYRRVSVVEMNGMSSFGNCMAELNILRDCNDGCINSCVFDVVLISGPTRSHFMRTTTFYTIFAASDSH